MIHPVGIPPAPASADSPTPIRISRSEVVPCRHASRKIATVMPTAPAKVTTGSSRSGTVSTCTITTIAASAAPALMPSKPGSASGLRITAWQTAPATPSAVPSSTAITARGRRSPVTIVSTCAGTPSAPTSAPRICPTGSL